MDDSGHRYVQKAHVAKKITKSKWDLVSCSAARCRCVIASSPPRLNISKASPTKSRIRCCWSKMQQLMCSLKSSDIALSWKYNDFGSLPEELELYLDIIGKSRVLMPILFPWKLFFVSSKISKKSLQDSLSLSKSTLKAQFFSLIRMRFNKSSPSRGSLTKAASERSSSQSWSDREYVSRWITYQMSTNYSSPGTT